MVAPTYQELAADQVPGFDRKIFYTDPVDDSFVMFLAKGQNNGK